MSKLSNFFCSILEIDFSYKFSTPLKNKNTKTKKSQKSYFLLKNKNPKLQHQTQQRRLNFQFSTKIVINQTLLNKKIQLIRKYYLQIKKSLVFFNDTEQSLENFDRKKLEKEIFQLFFSTQYYQGPQQNNSSFSYQLNDKKWLINKENFKFLKKMNQRDKQAQLPLQSANDIKMNNFNNSNSLEFSQLQQNNHNRAHESQPLKNRINKQLTTTKYHYYGQILKSIQTTQSVSLPQSNAEGQNRQKQSTYLHGLGLLINFNSRANHKSQIASQSDQNIQIDTNDVPSSKNIPNASNDFLIDFYIGHFNNDLIHGFGIKVKQHLNSPSFIQIYLGQFINGKQDDQSAVFLKKYIHQVSSAKSNPAVLNNMHQLSQNQQKYYGGFISGKKHGKGKIQSYQLFYDGEWRFGKPQGIGQLWSSASYYQGKFKSSFKHGVGKQFFKNGDLYQGEYSNNKPSGLGKYLWKNGNFYEGEFKNGLRDGKGLWKCGNQSYQGTYLNDKKCGQGIYYWNNGQTYYKGGFYEDLRHGYGQMYWDNRVSVYKGNWKDGYQDGFGQILQLDRQINKLRTIKKGQFVKGKMLEPFSNKNQSLNEMSKVSESRRFKNQITQSEQDLLKNSPSKNINQLTKQIASLEPIQIRINQPNSNIHKNSSKSKSSFHNFDEIVPSVLQNNKKRLNNPIQRKRFFKSQNNSFTRQNPVNEKRNDNKNERYPPLKEKDQAQQMYQKQRQHLYGSVYLIKSGRKRAVSSYKGIPQVNRNHPNNSYSNNSFRAINQTKNHVNKIDKQQNSQQILSHKDVGSGRKKQNFRQKNIKEQSKNQNLLLQKLKNRVELSKNPIKSIKQTCDNQNTQFQTQNYLSQLQPLVWNNFYKHKKKRINLL